LRLNGETAKADEREKPEFVPAYTMEDAMGVIKKFLWDVHTIK